MREGTSANAQIYFSKKANEDMRIYNAAMRISRMDLLRSMLNLHIDAAAGKIDQAMEKALTRQARAVYLDQSKILGETIIQNMDRIPAIVNASFHGATFSERILGWHQQELKSKMQSILVRGLVLSEHPDRFRKMIAGLTDQETKKACKAAFRLLNTELARVQSAA